MLSLCVEHIFELCLGWSQIQHLHPCGPPERLPPGRQIAKAAPAGAPAEGGRGNTPLPAAWFMLAACNAAMGAMGAMNLIDVGTAENMCMIIRYYR